MAFFGGLRHTELCAAQLPDVVFHLRNRAGQPVLRLLGIVNTYSFHSCNLESNLLVHLHVVYLRLVHETDSLSVNTEILNVVRAYSYFEDQKPEVQFSKL